MIETARIFCLLLCIGASDKDRSTTTEEFCAVADKLIQGTLTFTRRELDVLQRINREDIAALKRYRRDNCEGAA
jgi:hypothetical protein